MNAHCRAFDGDSVIEIDPDVAKLIVGMKKAARWSLLPYGWFEESDGSYVIFDRRYRLLCLTRPNGYVQILPFAEQAMRETDANWIRWRSQHWIYSDLTHPDCNAFSRSRVLGVVERLGLKDEIIRRREVLRRQRLAGWRRLRPRFAR
ncbi:hypothetical protein NP284_40095 [Rhodopseudomonas pseudopalustris]|uniref:hypothetical protein n=1 Tax=Rhodopseudomonas pseudopalustris TaxID=1513892 RepID=UPI003F9D4906